MDDSYFLPFSQFVADKLHGRLTVTLTFADLASARRYAYKVSCIPGIGYARQSGCTVSVRGTSQAMASANALSLCFV